MDAVDHSPVELAQRPANELPAIDLGLRPAQDGEGRELISRCTVARRRGLDDQPTRAVAPVVVAKRSR